MERYNYCTVHYTSSRFVHMYNITHMQVLLLVLGGPCARHHVGNRCHVDAN
jgi:hypothetical protein